MRGRGDRGTSEDLGSGRNGVLDIQSYYIVSQL